jgi:hypothetical protein
MSNIFIDAEISQNSSFSGATSIPITATPTLYATLGLDLSTAGPNRRVQFTTTVGVSSIASVAVPVTIDVYRVVGSNLIKVYSATETSEAAGTVGVISRKIFTLTGADFDPPAQFLLYQAFISIPRGVAVAPTRSGPESFNAQAFSD